MNRVHRTAQCPPHGESPRDTPAYTMMLGEGISWSFTAAPEVAIRLDELSGILGLTPGGRPGAYAIHLEPKPLFRSLLKRLRSCGQETRAAREFTAGPVDFTAEADDTRIVCSVGRARSIGRIRVGLWRVLHAIYAGLAREGGLALHAALIRTPWGGCALVGSEGAGKTTCCAAVPADWQALSDDALVTLPGVDSPWAHPFPTWSAVIAERGGRVHAQERVPLPAIFFIEQGPHDVCYALGKGETTALLTASASYICAGEIRPPGYASEIRRRLFHNAERLAASIPAFRMIMGRGSGFVSSIRRAMGNETS